MVSEALIKLHHECLTPGLGAGPGNPRKRLSTEEQKAGSPSVALGGNLAILLGKTDVQRPAWESWLDPAVRPLPPPPGEEALMSTLGIHLLRPTLHLAVLLTEAPAPYSWKPRFRLLPLLLPVQRAFCEFQLSCVSRPENRSPSSSLLSHSALSLVTLVPLELPLSLLG